MPALGILCGGKRMLGIHSRNALLEAVASRLASAMRTRVKVLRSSGRRKRIVFTLDCQHGAVTFAVREVQGRLRITRVAHYHS
jgi:hypothetical protein